MEEVPPLPRKKDGGKSGMVLKPLPVAAIDPEVVF